MKKNKTLITVLISNFNNAKYITQGINSIIKQKTKNIEIIVIDDQSSDESVKKIKKFKNVKLLKTAKKTNYGSYNQMNAYKLGLKKAKGEIIFFMDSDDFFHIKKIKVLEEYFLKVNDNLLLDKPYIYFTKKKYYKLKIKNRSKFIIPWQNFSPQSCFVGKKKYLKEIFKKISIKKFPNIWLDFRIIAQATIDYGNIKIINEYLTFYRQSPNSVSNKYKKFSKNWWIRRNEAYLFLKYIYKLNKKKLNISVDSYFTKLINLLI